MNNFAKIAIVVIIGVGLVGLIYKNYHTQGTGAPPYAIWDLDPPESPYEWINNWVRPEGSPRVGLQAGHMLNSELPDELERLRGNTGASGGGFSEWEVNLRIAQETKKLLEENGIVVDILPATIPPRYWADVFVAIHADGSTDFLKSGFKVASPRRDYSGGAKALLSNVEASYGEETNMDIDPNVTRNMTGYYAFAWWRHEHAVHPRTASIILETGFLSSPKDRKIIADEPQIPARGLAKGILEYLTSEGLVQKAD